MFSTSLFSGPFVPFVWLFFCYQSREEFILKTNELILMQLLRSGLWGNGMKQSTLGMRRSQVKFTGGNNRWNLWTWYFKNGWTDFSAQWHKWSTGKSMKHSTSGSEGQRSRSQEAEVRFVRLAEALFSTRLGWVGFPVFVINTICFNWFTWSLESLCIWKCFVCQRKTLIFLLKLTLWAFTLLVSSIFAVIKLTMAAGMSVIVYKTDKFAVCGCL